MREVEEDKVTVHYVGWSSKWDATLKRRRHGKAVEGIMQVGIFFYSIKCEKKIKSHKADFD